MFSYVVLHYQNADITMQCVNKLLEVTTDGKIIIVDNASPNGSGKMLRDKYSNEPKVKAVFADKNEGFAKGNNIGYKYAKDEYSPDFIVVMNNDVLIESNDFESLISEFMNKESVDVCGPDIITLSGIHQNPLHLKAIDNKLLRRYIWHGIIKCLLLKSETMFSLYKSHIEKNGVLFNNGGLSENVFQCILHGACIVYGQRYINNEEFAFLPVTFMYGEENILYDYLQYKSYKTGVCNDSKVTHMQGLSTKNADEKGRFLFRLKNSTYSDYVQLKLRRNKWDHSKLSHIKRYE